MKWPQSAVQDSAAPPWQGSKAWLQVTTLSAPKPSYSPHHPGSKRTKMVAKLLPYLGEVMTDLPNGESLKYAHGHKVCISWVECLYQNMMAVTKTPSPTLEKTEQSSAVASHPIRFFKGLILANPNDQSFMLARSSLMASSWLLVCSWDACQRCICTFCSECSRLLLRQGLRHLLHLGSQGLLAAAAVLPSPVVVKKAEQPLMQVANNPGPGNKADLKLDLQTCPRAVCPCH